MFRHIFWKLNIVSTIYETLLDGFSPKNVSKLHYKDAYVFDFNSLVTEMCAHRGLNKEVELLSHELKKSYSRRPHFAFMSLPRSMK